jgi:glycosyltransferase involved in cell wall biosynthesis
MAGFPTKFAEAVSCNTAVIANATSDLADYIKDGKNGHIVRLESLSDDLYKIIADGNLPTVETDTFDYKNWVSDFDDFLNNF